MPQSSIVNSSILEILPRELIIEIIKSTPSQDLTTLSRLSTTFEQLTNKELYCAITITTYERAIACFETIAKSSTKASLVKILAVDFITFSEGSETFYSKFNAAAKRMENLEKFSFQRTKYPNSDTFLSECRFPHLKEISLTLPPDLSQYGVSLFINAHPQIRSLMIHPVPIWSVRWDFSPPISTPGVTDYMGTAGFMPSAKLKSCALSFLGSIYESTLSRLARHSAESLRTFIIVRPGWNMDIIETISRILPGVDYLSISQYTPTAEFPTTEALISISSSLQKFTSLTTFSYCYMLTSRNLEEEKAVVEEWSRACPTMTSCNLYGNAWELSEGVWKSHGRKHPAA